MSESLCRIGVLERSRTVASRVARVLRSASGLTEVAVETDPATLRSRLTDDPVLLAFDASDVDLALEWTRSLYPATSVITWASGERMETLLEAAARSSNVAAIVGWPDFASMPRPWELALAARRLVDPASAAPRLPELLAWGSTNKKFRPRTSADRDLLVGELTSLSARAGATSRTAARVGEVAHELLMNAMYDAPVDARGTELYAFDRKRSIELEEHEAPTLRFGADGIQLALQVVDPFGRLTRGHVLAGILRGRRAAGEGGEVLDTSGGGAGLGLYRIYAASTVVIVDVVPGRYTSVTVVFDMDVNPREARNLPVSLHLYDQMR